MTQVVGEVKQYVLGKCPKYKVQPSQTRPDQTRPDQRGNFTLYLGHFPNTYCFTSPTMCVISPTILLHFPNNFASFPQQYGSFPQQYGSLPQQYESFPQLVFSFPQQFCVTFPNPQKQISPPKKAFFINLRAIYHVKVPPPQPPFHVFNTIRC